MKLADLRKLSIRREMRIRFQLNNGMECVIDEHGIAKVPGLRAIPKFNLEEELAAAERFAVEWPTLGVRKAEPARSLNRQELEAMTASAGSAAAPGDHEED